MTQGWWQQGPLQDTLAGSVFQNTQQACALRYASRCVTGNFQQIML